MVPERSPISCRRFTRRSSPATSRMRASSPRLSSWRGRIWDKVGISLAGRGQTGLQEGSAGRQVGTEIQSQYSCNSSQNGSGSTTPSGDSVAEFSISGGVGTDGGLATEGTEDTER